MQSKDGILLETGTNEVEFMEFQLNDVNYGINVSKIQHLISLANVKITRVPQAAPCVIGSIHNHGVPIKIIDLKIALGVPSTEHSDPSRQLVMVTKFNGTTTAFLIDGISKIHRISWTRFNPLNESLVDDSSSGFSTGTITLEDRIVIILDLERLMISYFPNSFHKCQLDDIQTSYDKRREEHHVIYVEDSKVVRTLTQDILKKSGYNKIKTFENGEEALRYLRENNNSDDAPIDLVLTDIEMPMMDGLTLCRNIKSLKRRNSQESIPVIIYSSLITDEMARKCKSVGADAQLAKPEVDKIVRTIDQYCLGSTEG